MDMYQRIEMLLLIIAVLLAIIAIGLTVQVMRAYNKKIRKMENENLKQLTKLQSSIPRLHGNERLKFTNDLMEFINTLIINEIVYEKKMGLILDAPDKNLDVDAVIETVSTKVFESLKEDALVNPDLLVTSSFLSTYIQKRTVLEYLVFIKSTVASQL